MEKALYYAQCLGALVLGACIGFVPFWQWLTLGYATGWTLLFSAFGVVAFVVYYLMFLQYKMSNQPMAHTAGIGMMLSFIVAMACLLSCNLISENQTILVPLEDGSTGIVQLEQDRYYSPFAPKYRTLSVTEDSVTVVFQMMCDDGKLCYYRSSGRFEVTHPFVMSTIAAGQYDRFDYSQIVRNAMLETLIADRPQDSFALEDGIQKRVNQHLGLAEDSDCPVKIIAHLDIGRTMKDLGLSYY